MADSNTQLHWTDEQWNKVRQVIYEEARKARVAGNFLPLYGPLEPNADYVRQQAIGPQVIQQQVGVPPPATVLSVQDTQPLQLSTLQVEVILRSAQVADPELASALIAFRRAANILARLEDDIIFNGQLAPDQGPPPLAPAVPGAPQPPWQVRGGQTTPGLLRVPGALPVAPVAAASAGGGGRSAAAASGGGPASVGEALVTRISSAIGQLEASYHLGPFACVLDQNYFTAVQTPTPSLVLPQDRILPFLSGGTLVRSSVLRPNSGLVIALSGAAIDLVVATDISVTFLQVTSDPFFVFRVYEKIVLRIKQPDAIGVL
jgi:uncharacterized linocin/CFP29 family protein